MIHTYSLFGQNIALDVNSGAVHVLDDLSFKLLSETTQPLDQACPDAVIASAQGYSQQEVMEAWTELYDLQKQGLLHTTDTYESRQQEIPDAAPVKALCLHVSHDCNMRCGYCFASTGDFGTGRKLMPIETAKAAIDFVVAASGKRRNIEVDFFGGEPLMAFDVVMQTVTYARELEEKHNKRFRFTITTNGLALNKENTRYINENMDNIVLSLDGRPEVNDAVRKTVDGRGSYAHIMPKFQALVKDRTKDYFARGTFTRHNLDFANDVLHIAGQGFKYLSVEPAVGDDQYGFSIREEELPEVFEEYERLGQIMLENNSFEFFHFNIDLEQGPCVIKRLRGCGAGFEYAAITPEGDIYPCHQFVGNEEYRLGNLFEKTFDMTLSRQFARMNIYTREGCRDCWAKFYCSGGCSALNFNTNKDISKPDTVACRMERKRVECAIALKAARQLGTR